MTIEELKALLDKATRGPWKWVRDHSGLGGPWRLTPGVMWPSNSEATPGGDEIDRANASLIVLAPQITAALVVAERALNMIDAIDPEDHVYGCSNDALRGFVIRMGQTARAAHAEITKLTGDPDAG